MESLCDFLVFGLVCTSAMMLLVAGSLWVLFLRVGDLVKASTTYYRKESHRIQLLDMLSQKTETQDQEIRMLRRAVAFLYSVQTSPMTSISEIDKIVKAYDIEKWG